MSSISSIHERSGNSTIALAEGQERPAAFQRGESTDPWSQPGFSLDQLKVANRDERHLASWVASGAQRIFVLESEDALVQKAVNGQLTGLGRRIGQGGFHSAYEVQVHDHAGAKQTPWIALLSNTAPQLSSRKELELWHWPAAKREHDHNQVVAAAAPDLLPKYGGVAAVIESNKGPDAPSAHRVRFAAIWERKDATLSDIVDQGGIANGASLKGYRLGAADVSTSLIKLSDAYQKVHDRGMAYTDPKDGNIAIGLAAAPLPLPDAGAPPSAPDTLLNRVLSGVRHLFRGKEGTEQDLQDLVDRRKTIIKDVVFIDSEAMQRPGYATDPEAPVSPTFTPAWIAKDILLANRAQDERPWKRAQANEANDVFHMAAIGYGMVTGKAPQEDLAHGRAMAKIQDAGIPINSPIAARVRADEVMAARLSSGFAYEAKALQANVAAGVIPAGLATTLQDGLEGRITAISTFRERLVRSQGEIT